MIGKDRIELNKRFIEVFKLLQEKGKIVKNNQARGLSAFAETVLGSRRYGHIVRKWLREERFLDYKHARTICREFDVSESFLLDGVGDPFEYRARHKSDAAESLSEGNIIHSNAIVANAGVSVDVGHFMAGAEKLNYFIPGISGQLFSFEVRGNSMYPKINEGDVVICTKVQSIEQVKDNEIYAVNIGGSLWVKYVKKLSDKFGRVRRLKLISENHMEHDPFEEDVNNHTRLYKVVRLICGI